MTNIPDEITVESIINDGKKFCVGHTAGYALHISGHYFVAYEDLPILYLWVDFKLSKVSVYFSDGSSASWANDYFNAYITQFGISVSNDGNFIFAQTWENGLYCFSSQNGEKIWKTQRKAAVKNIHVNSNTICINRKDKSLELLELSTGNVVCERKITIHEFFSIDNNRMMCRTTAKKWEVIDSNTLETVDTFSPDDTERVRAWFSVLYT